MRLWPWNCENPKEAFKVHPKTLQKSYNVVTSSQPNAISMSFYSCMVLTHDKSANKWLWAFGVPWSPRFVVGLPPRRGFWKQSEWPPNKIHLMKCRSMCRFYIHLAFTCSVGPSNIVWNELEPTPLLQQWECLKYNGHMLSICVCEAALSLLPIHLKQFQQCSLIHGFKS
jgi:hypothetical protein